MTITGTTADGRQLPQADVVMKGGITSGVVYPKALSRLGQTYRLRGIGGASAGAIGAAIGAAAEFARATGHGDAGYRRLDALPHELGEGRLAALFQPEASTKPLLRIMMTATGNDRPGAARKGLSRYVAVVAAVALAFPLAGVIGIAPGVALVVYGALARGLPGILLIIAGILLSTLGWIIAVLTRLARKLTVDVPGNLFGICRGLGRDAHHPGFTDWLSQRIDEVAGLPAEAGPLRFGQLWSGTRTVPDVVPAEREIDLRMVSTCLSQGRPYELPFDALNFFFDPETWSTLFPRDVMEMLMAAPRSTPSPAASGGSDEWDREERMAAAHSPSLRRLPGPEELPVIVAARLSLSFPLLISAVPLWTIDRRSRQAEDLVFTKLWFTDGGFCSNFPVHLFDSALPSRPTFAINLGPFPTGKAPSRDQRENVEYARDNTALPPTYVEIPERGLRAVGEFGRAAFNTARNWHDSSQLDAPGYRDRIVRVLQTTREGGLNLHMDADTIDRLAERGRTAADVIVEQFTRPRYPVGNPTATGWDNHRWVRYRALLSTMPDWLGSYLRGRQALDIDPGNPPDYKLDQGRRLAKELSDALDVAARIAATADPQARDDLTKDPLPRGMIRRIPQI